MDPISDIDAIDYELSLSDREVVQNRAGRMAKAAKSGNNKGAAAEAAWLQQLADHLSAGKPARSFDFDEGDAEQQAVLHEMGLLSAKPVLYACNVGEDEMCIRDRLQAEQPAAGAVIPHQLHQTGHAQCAGKDGILGKHGQHRIAKEHHPGIHNISHCSPSASFCACTSTRLRASRTR